jgi:hypothetical protein
MDSEAPETPAGYSPFQWGTRTDGGLGDWVLGLRELAHGRLAGWPFRVWSRGAGSDAETFAAWAEGAGETRFFDTDEHVAEWLASEERLCADCVSVFVHNGTIAGKGEGLWRKYGACMEEQIRRLEEEEETRKQAVYGVMTCPLCEGDGEVPLHDDTEDVSR